MNILVAIANYGSGNREHLERLLAEYRSVPWRVSIVVLSNIPKSLGDDVEVAVGLPTKDPWSLPFAHRKLFEERADRYDLFIYSEDDTLVTARNIRAFLEVSAELPANVLAGFMRTETAPNGRLSLPEVHGFFHWEPASVRVSGGRTFAHFTNEHAACYMMTRAQLKRAIASGGFVVPPHQERYDLLVTAATDPYTQCGFRRLVCVSSLEDFLLPHLPNKYIGRIGASWDVVAPQIRALLEAGRRSSPGWSLLESETRLPRARWSKDFYEPADERVMRLIPGFNASILSIGCGCGALEESLEHAGHRVVAIPLDSVIAASAEARGIELVDGPFERAVGDLKDQRFDVAVCSNLLHLVPDPQAILRPLHRLLVSGGSLLASVPNMSRPPTWLRCARREPGFRDLGHYGRTGVNWSSESALARWLRASGFVPQRFVRHFTGRGERLNHRLRGTAGRWLASDVLCAALRD
jgi:2-polyprenyl-3-methyl-5-hydroxy-6-metoxy-1,4-benzoquinol methylase